MTPKTNAFKVKNQYLVNKCEGCIFCIFGFTNLFILIDLLGCWRLSLTFEIAWQENIFFSFNRQ